MLFLAEIFAPTENWSRMWKRNSSCIVAFLKLGRAHGCGKHRELLRVAPQVDCFVNIGWLVGFCKASKYVRRVGHQSSPVPLWLCWISEGRKWHWDYIQTIIHPSYPGLKKHPLSHFGKIQHLGMNVIATRPTCIFCRWSTMFFATTVGPSFG